MGAHATVRERNNRERGICAGGSNSFRFAAEVAELNAAVVFYGGGLAENLLTKINAPVLGFYGENDARVTATADHNRVNEASRQVIRAHVYPKVTHSFVYFWAWLLGLDSTSSPPVNRLMQVHYLVDSSCL
jgi:pimeloyl-ACP methyl ester carboxylesterase